ncbi:MAG TPA: SDR family NAD(P)-dependent oxidoreductase [Burkholderiaceae bacterium]|nr:SDR family NAD(P)-dependent oxidoreductase [Burkholderiaceae bacterium]
MKPIQQQVALVTGATDGLGRGVATELARRGATVLLHGRDASKLEATRTAIARDSSNSRLRTYRADFASLEQIRSLAANIIEHEPQLDVLVNNAGIGVEQSRRTSEDALELTFQVDYLSTYMLSRLLLPLLKTSAPARIVNVASAGQAPIDFRDPLLEQQWNGVQAYCQAKLAQIMLTVDMARELEGENVTVNALHPASYMPTKIVVGMFGVQSTLEEGVQAVVRLACSPEVEGVSGRYFDRQRAARPNAQALDAEARRKLAQLSAKLTNVPAKA